MTTTYIKYGKLLSVIQSNDGMNKAFEIINKIKKTDENSDISKQGK